MQERGLELLYRRRNLDVGVLGAILAVRIGFGLQNIAQNFVSGLILLVERPVKKGDLVEVGGVKGSVREFHARATVVTTLDNVDIIVPNGQFITEQVVNQTYENRRVRLAIEVGVADRSDTELVRRTLRPVSHRRQYGDLSDSPEGGRRVPTLRPDKLPRGLRAGARGSPLPPLGR